MTGVLTNHPAKFSPEILAQLRAIVQDEAHRLGRPPTLLDPFAGTGRIFELADIADITGVEIEPEWAACRKGTIVGDATDLPAGWTNRFDIIATSPVYPNRMTDSHNAQDACGKCKGDKKVDGEICDRCKGSGLSPRKNYRAALGRMPTEGSAATLGWSSGVSVDRYKDLHRRFLREAARVLDDGALLIVNMKNHPKTVEAHGVKRQQVMRVVEWWLEAMLAQGFYMVAVIPVATRGMKFGANLHSLTIPEQLICVRKPFPLLDAEP